MDFDRTLDQLSERVHGEILEPDDEGYDDARTVWNAMIDRRPAVIVRCTGAADVMAVVNAARKDDLLLSVKVAAITSRGPLSVTTVS